MPDQSQQTPNAARINAMLQDLAAQRTGSAPVPAPTSGSATPVPLPTSASPRPTPPPNLPTAPVRPPPPPPPAPVGATPPPRPVSPPPAPREPVATAPALPKPPVPPPQSAAPAVIAPIPATKQPASAEVSTELRTMSADIGNLRVGQAPQGIKPPSVLPSAPAASVPQERPSVVAPPPITPPPPVTAPSPVTPPPISRPSSPTPPSIVIPPASSSGSGIMRKALFAVVGVLILGSVAFGLVALLGGSETAPVATETPSPSTSPTITLVGKTLSSYLGNPATVIDFKDDATAVVDFQNGFMTIQPTTKLATVVSVTRKGVAVSGQSFLNALAGRIPAPLLSALGSDWILLAYGQSELFDASGVRTESATPQPKVAIVIEISDASAARQAMLAWESAGLATASAPLLGHDATKKIVDSFSEGAYRTIPVRYWNFPYADSSVDYAIVTASNNKNYLVLSASRESAFFVIDQLMR